MKRNPAIAVAAQERRDLVAAGLAKDYQAATVLRKNLIATGKTIADVIADKTGSGTDVKEITPDVKFKEAQSFCDAVGGTESATKILNAYAEFVSNS